MRLEQTENKLKKGFRVKIFTVCIKNGLFSDTYYRRKDPCGNLAIYRIVGITKTNEIVSKDYPTVLFRKSSSL